MTVERLLIAEAELRAPHNIAVDDPLLQDFLLGVYDARTFDGRSGVTSILHQYQAHLSADSLSLGENSILSYSGVPE